MSDLSFKSRTVTQALWLATWRRSVKAFANLPQEV